MIANREQRKPVQETTKRRNNLNLSGRCRNKEGENDQHHAIFSTCYAVVNKS